MATQLPGPFLSPALLLSLPRNQGYLYNLDSWIRSHHWIDLGSKSKITPIWSFITNLLPSPTSSPFRRGIHPALHPPFSDLDSGIRSHPWIDFGSPISFISLHSPSSELTSDRHKFPLRQLRSSLPPIQVPFPPSPAPITSTDTQNPPLRSSISGTGTYSSNLLYLCRGLRPPQRTSLRIGGLAVEWLFYNVVGSLGRTEGIGSRGGAWWWGVWHGGSAALGERVAATLTRFRCCLQFPAAEKLGCGNMRHPWLGLADFVVFR